MLLGTVSGVEAVGEVDVGGVVVIGLVPTFFSS
jgi:hypothetical protein